MLWHFILFRLYLLFATQNYDGGILIHATQEEITRVLGFGLQISESKEQFQSRSTELTSTMFCLSSSEFMEPDI